MIREVFIRTPCSARLVINLPWTHDRIAVKLFDYLKVEKELSSMHRSLKQMNKFNWTPQVNCTALEPRNSPIIGRKVDHKILQSILVFEVIKYVRSGVNCTESDIDSIQFKIQFALSNCLAGRFNVINCLQFFMIFCEEWKNINNNGFYGVVSTFDLQSKKENKPPIVIVIVVASLSKCHFFFNLFSAQFERCIELFK